MQKPSASKGNFELFYRRGWAFLCVFPPSSSARQVYTEDIENRMRLLGMPHVRTKILREIIEEASGEPVALIEWPGGHAFEISIAVDIAKDKMSASISVQAPKKGSAPPSLDDLEDALRREGIVYGIDFEDLQRILTEEIYGKPIPVAAGLEPIRGRKHRIAYHFNTNRGKPYLEMDFGRINLRELNFIENCREGDLLAELEPPIIAVDGRTVEGEVVSAGSDEEEATLRAGPNTQLSEDGTKLFALCDGNVRFDTDAVLVEPIVTVQNVNYETGNIKFDGSVVIEGSIADGFTVDAGGDIQVGSSVGKAILKAKGSVLLKTGINGNGEGKIECGGDLFAKYIVGCDVECRGHVIVEEAIMQTKLRTIKHCVLNGRRSEVIASDLIVGASFWCKKLGNFNEAATRLALGVEPRLLLAYRNTTSAIEEKQAEFDKVEHQLEQLEKLIQDVRTDERSTLRVRQAQSQLNSAFDQLKIEIASLRSRLPELRDKLMVSRSSIAVIEEEMFRGVIINFGTNEYRVPDAGVRKMILRVVGHEILESGFNHKEKPELAFE